VIIRNARINHSTLSERHPKKDDKYFKTFSRLLALPRRTDHWSLVAMKKIIKKKPVP